MDGNTSVLPGPIALLGSGETTTAGGQLFEALARRLPQPLKISVLETPAGFELNSPAVAGRVADFMKIRLQNYRPMVQLIPARRKGTEWSPDDANVVAPMLTSDLLYMGAGSPTYAVRQLQGSLAWQILQARHRHGAAVVLSSASAIAAGQLTLPVYEIYKVGEEPSWKPGLDLLAPFGLDLIIISHWNNNDGGAELDTSRCFIGRARFDPLLSRLHENQTIVGLDEQTGLLMDLQNSQCQVLGKDAVHIFSPGQDRVFYKGDTFPIDLLGPFHLPQPAQGDLPGSVWQMASEAHERALQPVALAVPEDVLLLVEQRQQARSKRAWGEADVLRRTIGERGWKVVDTPDGPQVEPLS